MQKNTKQHLCAGLITLLLSPLSMGANPLVQTNAGNRSVIVQENHAPVSVHYQSTTKNYYPERLGKKIVIRKMYIVPFDRFSVHGCSPDVLFKNCGDFYEAVQVYLEVQSIWPEPVLLTAARLDVIAPKHNFDLGPKPGGGRHSLSEMITATSNPEDFLLQPGTVKLINLGRGLRLNGVLAFFDEQFSDVEILTATTPYAFYDLTIVDNFNRFLRRTYGAKAALKISLYEKGYQPILITVANLSEGTDFFGRGDPTKRNGYNFLHDHFVAEVLYQLRGGTDSLTSRMFQKNK
ncbi:hypothetical protein [Duganella sp. HH105]|uniref:hypothetical protein n=1 Tax=Duganella sp. HH105 TaxID=1781067 RepID=UPI00114CDF66|nr:hypothetical protein [Duganella sp. HH105]